MGFAPLRYEPYHLTDTVPNVVVDGSPNAATTLTLTHWPGHPAPPEVADDLSAQIAFRYAELGTVLHEPAEVVTNNHFDQDGLVAVFALSRPDDALPRRAFLEDVAAAGDFATYRYRDAARVAMALAAFADPDMSPLHPLPADVDEAGAALYTELLGRLPELIDRLDDHRRLWEDEDRRLSASETALASGHVTVQEHPEVDLAVVTVAEAVGDWTGHRFGFPARGLGLHPMALHNATDRFVLLVVRGRRYELSYRYETWVQYRTRRPRPRVELGALARELTADEAGGARWEADPVGQLTPQLRLAGEAESSLDPDDVVPRIVRHLGQAPSAWDPYRERARSE